MISSSLFILFLLLENLFLPAFAGPGPFFIIPIFLLALLVYRKSFKLWLLQAAIFILAYIFFTGTEIKTVVVPLGLTAIIYMWAVRFLNFNEQLKDSISFPAIAGSTIVLTILSFFYSGFSIILDNAFDLATSWNQLVSFALSSLADTIGWSAGISILFKFIKINK